MGKCRKKTWCDWKWCSLLPSAAVRRGVRITTHKAKGRKHDIALCIRRRGLVEKLLRSRKDFCNIINRGQGLEQESGNRGRDVRSCHLAASHLTCYVAYHLGQFPLPVHFSFLTSRQQAIEPISNPLGDACSVGAESSGFPVSAVGREVVVFSAFDS